MLLSELIQQLPEGTLRPLTTGHADPEISDIAYDSRRAGPGSLFVAARGEKADGHAFLPAAIANGAAAIVGEDETALRAAANGRPAYIAENSRRAMAEL